MSSPPAGHSHRLPPGLLAGLAVIVLGLVGSLVLVAQQAIATNNRLTALEQYVAGKGQARDQENTRLNDRIDQAVCSVLDQLPAGGRLDVIRQEYGCGPGLPAAASPTAAPAPSAAGPAAAATGAPQSAVPTAARSSPRPAPTTTTAAVPTSSRPRASTAPAAPPPAPAPTVGPPAGPVTSVLCGVLPQLCKESA